MIRIFLALALNLTAGPLFAAEKTISPLGREAAAYLSDLVRINTVNPPGNERAACDYLAGVLRSAGIPFDIYESTPGRANIVARLKGDGSKGPVLLLAHLDTVGVEEHQWSFPPFSGEVKDGYLLGRGAIDDKSMAASYLAVLLELKRTKTKLKRDVIFAATADEESGAAYGVRWMLENHPQALSAEFALNEGGSTYRKGDAVRLVAIQTLEKSYYDIRLTARGSSGHASVPLPHNPIFMLGRALSRIETWDRPMRVNLVTRSYMEGVARWEERVLQGAIRDILSDEPELVENGLDVLRKHPYYSALLQDTVVPTFFDAGVRANVVPSEAKLNLNVRLLPDSDPEEFLQELSGVVDESGIEIEIVDGPNGPPPPPMEEDSEMFSAIRRAVSKRAPKADVVPSMSVGSTDAEFLRRNGVKVYGIQFPLSTEEEARIHGHDEKIPLTGLDFGTHLIIEVLREIGL